jgi:hypothetical protein
MTSPQRQGGESTQKTANGQQKHPHNTGKRKAVPLHAMVALGGRGVQSGVGSGTVRGECVLAGGQKGCYWWKTV